MATNLEIAGALKRTQKGDADWYYGGDNEAWPDLATAKTNIPTSIRPGKTIGVFISGKIVEYWWPTPAVADTDLIEKTTPLPQLLGPTDDPTFGDLTIDNLTVNGLNRTHFRKTGSGAGSAILATVYAGNVTSVLDMEVVNGYTGVSKLISLYDAPETGGSNTTKSIYLPGVNCTLATTAQVDTHANSTSNPHATTLEQARAAGSAFGGDVNMATHRLLNIPDATSPNEPVSKQQFDTYNNSVGGNRAGIDCTANPNYPTAVKGDRFEVTFAGKIGGAAGIPVDQYDEIVCATASTAGDQATVGSNFYIVQGNVQRATQSTSGYVQLATSAEAIAGTDANKPLTPLTTLALVADQRKNYTKSISLSRGTPFLNEAVIYFPTAGSITSIVGIQITNILVKTAVGGTYAAASLPMSIASAGTLFIQFDYSSSTFLNGNITITGRDN